MGIFKNFKDFLNKVGYDFDRSDITLYNFHPQLRICLAINGIFFNNRDSLVRFILPVLNTLMTTICIAFQMMFTWHGIDVKDYAFATECFCYIVACGTAPLVYSSVLLSKDAITELVENMHGHFIQICTLGARYKNPFMEGQKLIWKLCYVWLIFITFTGSLFALQAIALLTYQSLFATQDEYTVRPLAFPMWLPADDPYRTPNYEIFMFFQIVLISCVIQSFGVYVYMFFHFLLHYYYVMEMIILDFEVLFEEVDDTVARLTREHPARARAQLDLNTKMKRIVTWHTDVFKSVKSLSSIYGPPLVYQVVISAIAICLMAYQVVEQLEDGKFDFVFATLLVATCVQLWIPCYLGTLIRNKAFEVGDACFNCGWHASPLGLLLRNDIVVFILRAQQPLTIQFTGLPTIQLETFSSIMSTSYSYFNMLRQHRPDK